MNEKIENWKIAEKNQSNKSVAKKIIRNMIFYMLPSFHAKKHVDTNRLVGLYRKYQSFGQYIIDSFPVGNVLRRTLI